ncbi:hypothetical protein F0251_22125 [Vibrio sp. 070316B]|uniref:hypothetical protein n=1 Tax=Vibrio sp. 070316B TaxID=2607608 RepID=UPI001493381E|nr:hypothetical protein [Vibrio sp. 070316B]NOI41109.1 hypothetical protein [Vibrio sp. 070316B]
MSVRQAKKNKRRQARKKVKAAKSKPYSPAPAQNVIDGVKPLLIEYIQSEQKYLDIFKSLERGQVYVVGTEGPQTMHTVLSEDEYLDLMPQRDRTALATQFALLESEKVVGYTEDESGFMTYFFAENEVLQPQVNRENSNALIEKRPMPDTVYVSETGQRIYVEDVVGEMDDEFYLVMTVPEEDKDHMDAMGDELDSHQWVEMIDLLGLELES